MLHKETAAPAVAQIVTGYFQEKKNYSTWRTFGTNDYLLMLTLRGAGRIGYVKGNTAERIVQPGEIVLIRPHTRHDYGTARSAEEWELLWAHFQPYSHWLELMAWPEIATGVTSIGLLTLSGEVQEKVTMTLWEMFRRASGGQNRREAFAMNALEQALLWCDTVNPRSERPAHDLRVEQAVQYLREHLAEAVSLPDLARAVGLSPSRLSHLFREQIGQTPGQFLERERMTRARQLLTLTSRPITAISTEVGFENPFYFTLRFRKHTGMSPRDFRRRLNDAP